ncbi:type III secretion system export apparatus subunit SctT [Cognatiyoonia sp. IB215182]|uniref:type III secretion system export apparatus subunit SctT n=1 Tax=Cognatiyoonia sp. IB215182 TaxID=3097353 RepID=UPI002A112AFE|nr:type III secretion system export apparatus subunit SctT [Cognatiyoonia sp. IB215182]MDX8355141.1 type III secretion system export apparatus subunit SctT [Cognatiyoonia sp. IB215182]
MDILIGLYQQFEIYLLALLISIPRIYGFLTTAPILSPGVVPRMARNAAILIMCLPIVPVNLANADGIDRTLGTIAYFFAKEFAIGFVFGYMVGWIFWMITAVGDLIDNQRGAAIAASIDPLQGTETSPLGILFSQAFTTYFFSIGGMLVILNLLYTSYALWPVTEALPILSPDFPVLILGIFDHAMRAMFVLAAPVVAIMFLSEFALAMVSRFAPQIQVFILAMPIKSGVAIAILVFYCSLLFPYATDQASFFDVWTVQLYDILEIGRTVREGAAP